MLFSNTKNKSIVVIASLTALLLTSGAAAREDGGGGWSLQAAASLSAEVRPPVPATRYWAPAGVEPAAGGGLVLSAIQQKLATPRLAAPVATGDRLGAFASVAISAGKLPSAYKWRNAMATDFSALFTEGCAQAGLGACDTGFVRQLRAARTVAAGQSAAAALRTVNNAVNAALRYGSDNSVWGTGDYWATPAETAQKGAGDCEDFAITKLWLLRSLGYGADQLQLVVLQDTRKGVYHAVLAVHVDGQRYILDNLSDKVATDAAYPSYLPIMSFVGGKSYIHGFENRRSDTAGMPKDLTAVMPGEGV